MMRKILAVLIFLAIVLVGYTWRDLFLEWIRSGGNLAILVSILFVAILVFFPVMPFIAVSGIIGAVFGTWMGTLISLIGALLGAMLMFTMARYGFRDWAQKYVRKYPKAKEFETYFEENAFLSIVLVRVIPIVPSPVVNILCGISLVPGYIFFLASLIGKIPSIFIFTFAGSSFVNNKLTSLVIYGGYFLVIAVLTAIFMKKRPLGSERE
jgi:uncharacterized membrane protein YdjX (TVP38/TMEM64 family)